MRIQEFENKQGLELKHQLKIFFSISLGVFLFILFFQPFGIVRPDPNEKLLFKSGYAGILFTTIWIFRIAIPYIFNENTRYLKWRLGQKSVNYVLIWIIGSLGFIFYLRYVGPLRMSMFLVFKISIVCLSAMIILRAIDEQRILKELIQALLEKNKKLTKTISEFKKQHQPVEIFSSDSKSEILKIQISNLILVKSADNYVEIIYKDNGHVNKKLIRSTLKNIEAQLRKYPELIRCHRTCMVNKQFILNFNRSYAGYTVKVADYNKDVPVSRQYLLKVKEAMITE